MSAVETISIQGMHDTFASSQCTSDTNVYVVNRLFAKSGKADNAYKLHYKTNGVWIKCEHQSPLKKYSNMELEFRLFKKPVDLNDTEKTAEYDLDGKEIENTGYLDDLEAEKREAEGIRNIYIAARKVSQLKAKQVKKMRMSVKLTQEEIDELLSGQDFY
ncbi:hypothetical protein LPJ75_003631 [Coemansia sp. RSA 2598]|nr:hypothetical protein LPJ75_003631 [Coemansia sp. RSA 2598]